MNKIIKRILIGVGVFVGVVVLGAGGYVGYIVLSYNRIGDCDLTVDNKTTLNEVQVGETYKALTYNVGFGAYSQDYTFFMDTGYDDDGNETCGKWATARSKEEVEFNTNGAVNAVFAESPDFVCFQEVDTDSTRSYHVNQDKKIMEKFNTYDHVHAVNFHTAFLPYPFHDMIGVVNAGLTTISKYKVQSARRHEYTVSSSLAKLFDLDRCFSASIINVNNGRKLYLCNSHMSAYDEGGTVREEQVKELNAFLKERKDAGDYVVIGGDWNHDLLTNNPDFSYNKTTNRAFGMTKKAPDWVSYFFSDTGKPLVMDGYSVVASDNYPTCRNNDIQYIPDETFVCGIDGFIVSSNVEVISHANIQTKNGNKGLNGFAFADHDPAMMEFRLS